MVITVQQYVKRGYGRVVLGSLALALILQLQLFLFTPTFTPRPYVLEEIVFEVVNIPDEIEIPPLREAVKPPDPMPFRIEEGEFEEMIFPNTNVIDFEHFRLEVTGDRLRQARKFVAFDEAPVPTFKAEVRYPAMAREAEMEGTVFVKIFVDARGKVTGARVLSSTAPELLVAAALESVLKWRFTPGKQRNVPVPTEISVPIEFRLR
jgi:TonB family protein